jgi:hypothetical protein
VVFQDVPVPPDGKILERGGAFTQDHGEHRHIVRLQHHDQRVVALTPDVGLQVVHRIHQVDKAPEGCTQPVELWRQIVLPPGEQCAHQAAETIGRKIRVRFIRPFHPAEARKGLLNGCRLAWVRRANVRQEF